MNPSMGLRRAIPGAEGLLIGICLLPFIIIGIVQYISGICDCSSIGERI
jgi:hypothetical protein